MQGAPDTMQGLLDDAYARVCEVVAGLADDDFALRTRACAWAVRELLSRQLLDAQRALVAFASPTTAETDVDEVSYWRPFRPSENDGGADHARFVQQAAAHATHRGLVAHWRTTSRAAVCAQPTPRTRCSAWRPQDT